MAMIASGKQILDSIERRSGALRVVREQVAVLIAAANPLPDVAEGADMGDFERYAIIEALKHARGNLAGAAKVLRISHRVLQLRLQQWRGEKPIRW